MTAPIQEPTQGRVDQSQGFISRQLLRRPAPAGIGCGIQFNVVNNTGCAGEDANWLAVEPVGTGDGPNMHGIDDQFGNPIPASISFVNATEKGVLPVDGGMEWFNATDGIMTFIQSGDGARTFPANYESIFGDVPLGQLFRNDGDGLQLFTNTGADMGFICSGGKIVIDAPGDEVHIGGSGTWVILDGLPTSSAGLPSGTLWNNGGVVNVV